MTAEELNLKRGGYDVVAFFPMVMCIMILIGLVDCSNSYKLPKDIKVKFGMVTTDEEVNYFSYNEELRFLGLAGDDEVWVEAADGRRGIVPYQPGTLKITSGHSMEDLEKYHWSEKGGHCYTSLSRVKSWSMGRSLEEIERKWCPATDVFPSPIHEGHWQASFLKLVDLDDDGTFTDVSMVFDASKHCRAVFAGNKLVKRRNGKMLAKLPMATKIAGWNWVMTHVSEDLYETDRSERAWYWRWGYNILHFIIIYLIWAVVPVLIPMLLVVGLMRYDFMRHVPTWAIIVAGVIASLLVGHLWVVAILCWGYVWFFHLPLTLIAVLLAAGFAYTCLEDDEGTKASPVRCPKCGRVDSYALVHRDNLRTYKAVRREQSRIGSMVYRDDDSERTTTQHYNVYIHGKYEGTSEGHTTTYRKLAVNEYRDYEVTYDVTESDNTYRCACGATIIRKGEQKLREIGRKELGTHKETHKLDGEYTDSYQSKDSSGIRHYRKG